MVSLSSLINCNQANVKLEETRHDDPSIVQMKIDLEISMEKEELKKFKKLKIREKMVGENGGTGVWNHVYFVKYNDKTVGFLSLAESTFYENLAWLSYLFIVEEHRSRKIGSKALQLAKEIVSFKGFDYFGIRFEGDKRKRFYSKNGFKDELSCVNIAEL